MSNRDVMRIARELAGLKRAAEGAKVRQLPSSSVLLEDGTEKAIADGLGAGVDALDLYGSTADAVADVTDVATDAVLDQSLLPDHLAAIGAGTDAAFEISVHVAEAVAELEAARAELEEKLTAAREQLAATEILLVEIDARVEEAVGAASTADDTATRALTMAGTKSKVYYSTAAPSGTGSATGDLWRQIDASKNVLAEWYWTGTVWQPSQITTTAIANLDVGKLTVGTGIISDLVAQHIAARSGVFIQLGVDQLTVTGSAAIKQAVVEKLYTDVLKAKLLTVTEKIIANDIFAAGVVSANALAATAIDGKVITGATIRTAASGQRIHLDQNGLTAFDENGLLTAALNAASGGLKVGLVDGASDTGSVSMFSRKYAAAGAFPGGYFSTVQVRRASTSGNAEASLVADITSSGKQRASVSLRAGDLANLEMGVSDTGGHLTYSDPYQTTGPFRLDAHKVNSNRGLKVLWSGAVYMQGGQTINLSELISDQLSGIVLCWSSYGNGAAINTNFHYQFIPKAHIALHPGAGVEMYVNRGGALIRKYVYVNDSSIAGNAANADAPNGGMVLREVIGV